MIIGGHVKNAAPASAVERYASLTTQNYQQQPGGVRPSPGLAQRAAAAPGSLLPSALSPTKVASSMPLASDAKYPTRQALPSERREPSPVRTGSVVSPSAFTAHKSNSTGSLGTGSRPPHSALAPLARQSPTFPVSQQLSHVSRAGQQRDYTYALNPATLTQAPLHPRQDSKRKSGKKSRSSGYSSSATTASHTGRPPHQVVTSSRVHTLPAPVPPAAAFMGAASGGDISNVPGAVRRPMSFVKALEMADQLQMVERQKEAQSMRSLNRPYDVGDAAPGAAPDSNDDSQQHYGSSYEISV